MTSLEDHDRSPQYAKGSLTLWGAIAMGTGVMVGAGLFALTGQVAELAREWFALAFLVAAVISGFSAYTYVKLSNAWPSAGGIAMFLEKAYGPTAVTGALALLMALSMIINESLVARTFGAYTLQLFDVEQDGWLTSTLGVGLLAFAFVVNILSNRFIQSLSSFMAFLKIVGLIALAGGGLWASGFDFQSVSVEPSQTSARGFLGAVALAILAYKGFTTITNSGGEIVNPTKNVGRAIVISIGICAVLYLLVAVAVGSNLSIDEIVAARDYSLAQAARPAFGIAGLWTTVGFAIVATVSGVIASVFAVSRMLAMLTDMKLVPHRHLGMPGSIQKHTLVYAIGLAMLLTIFFDLSRIASLGAIFYLVMDIAIHWGVLRYLRKQVNAHGAILVAAIVLDGVVLSALVWVKAESDMLVVWASVIGLALVFLAEGYFVRQTSKSRSN